MDDFSSLAGRRAFLNGAAWIVMWTVVPMEKEEQAVIGYRRSARRGNLL